MDSQNFRVPTSQTLLKNLKDKVEQEQNAITEANLETKLWTSSPYEDGHESLALARARCRNTLKEVTAKVSTRACAVKQSKFI